ncbi:unnamed protein product [Prorocentrum cordatum]|nr:unnamed protein product [Polarella glacialis]
MNNTGVTHIVLGLRPPAQAYPVNAYLLYYNRSDHLPEALRSGVQFRNMGAKGVAEWARVGEGGSGVLPLFDERKACASPGGGWLRVLLWSLLVAAAGFAAGAGGRRLLERALPAGAALPAPAPAPPPPARAGGLFR